MKVCREWEVRAIPFAVLVSSLQNRPSWSGVIVLVPWLKQIGSTVNSWSQCSWALVAPAQSSCLALSGVLPFSTVTLFVHSFHKCLGACYVRGAMTDLGKSLLTFFKPLLFVPFTLCLPGLSKWLLFLLQKKKRQQIKTAYFLLPNLQTYLPLYSSSLSPPGTRELISLILSMACPLAFPLIPLSCCLGSLYMVRYCLFTFIFTFSLFDLSPQL